MDSYLEFFLNACLFIYSLHDCTRTTSPGLKWHHLWYHINTSCNSDCLALSRFNTAITTKTLNSRLGISHTVDFNSFPVYIDAKLMCVCKLNSWFVCLIHWTIDWQWLALRSPTDNDWATFLWTTLINVIEWWWNIRDIHMYKYSPVILMRSNAVHKST